MEYIYNKLVVRTDTECVVVANIIGNPSPLHKVVCTTENYCKKCNEFFHKKGSHKFYIDVNELSSYLKLNEYITNKINEYWGDVLGTCFKCWTQQNYNELTSSFKVIKAVGVSAREIEHVKRLSFEKNKQKLYKDVLADCIADNKKETDKYLKMYPKFKKIEAERLTKKQNKKKEAK